MTTAKEELKGFLHGNSIDTMKQGAAFRRYHVLVVASVIEDVTAKMIAATKKPFAGKDKR